MSRRRVIADTSNTGKKLPMVLPKYSAPGKVSMIPSTQPVMVMTRDSPKISMAICQPPNPRVFMMAYSPILSRAVMAMGISNDSHDDNNYHKRNQLNYRDDGFGHGNKTHLECLFGFGQGFGK